MGRRMELVVEAENLSRLDRYLMGLLPGESRTSIQRLIQAGHVRLGGKPLKSSARLHPGDRLEV